MREELARAFDFLARGDMGATRTEPSAIGTAFFTDELPLRLDANYLRIERDASPEEVAAEARRHERRMILVPESELGERLAPYFDERAWRVRREVVMAQHREPDREHDLSVVREVREEDLRPARRRLNAGMPWGAPEVIDQIFAGKQLIAQRMQAQFFAVVVDGEVVTYADLYQDGSDGQIEDVGTLHEHRERGYASAVVLAAVAAARKAGADFVFLVADREDWPKELYGRLGFDELGYFVKLVNP